MTTSRISPISPTGKSIPAMASAGIWRICAISSSLNTGRGLAAIMSRKARTSERT
jgi:hypothetical protein